MKICYVAVDVVLPHYRGSSTHVYELARNLKALGHEVHVVARRASSREAANEEIDGLAIHRLRRGIIFTPTRSSASNLGKERPFGRRNSGFLWKLYELYLTTIFSLYAGMEVASIVKNENLDVILERESSFGAGVIAGQMTGRPVVLEVIGNRVTKAQIIRSKKIITYSRSNFDGIVDGNKLETLTGAANVEMFRPDPESGRRIRDRYKIGGGPVIGYVGTFHKWHGLRELIEASRIVRERYPDVKFLMVGPYYEDTQAMVVRMGLATSFVFTGAVEYRDVPKYMCSSDILVAPYNPGGVASSGQVSTQRLGSPLKLYEYMSTCTPVISTDVEPISSLIEDDVTGILIPPGDSEALGKAIIELLQDKDMAEEIGRNGRTYVVKSFTWEMIAIKVSNLLGTCLAPSPKHTEPSLSNQ